MCFRLLLLLGSRDQGFVPRAGRPHDGGVYPKNFRQVGSTRDLCCRHGRKAWFHCHPRRSSPRGEGLNGLIWKCLGEVVTSPGLLAATHGCNRASCGGLVL